MKRIKLAQISLQQIVVFLILILSLIYFRYNWIFIENEQIGHLLRIAGSIEVSLPKDVLKALEVKASDVDKPQYRIIKEKLKAIIRVNGDARFAYIYTLRNDKICFIADSEPEDSKDYSPPGQEFAESDLSYQQFFENGKGFVTEPFTDRWGMWRSVLVPVTDENTGKIIAVFGMDFNADAWKKRLIYELAESSVLMLLLLITLVLLLKIRKKNKLLNRDITQRKRVGEKLRQTQEQLEFALSGTNDGIWDAMLDTGAIYLSPRGFEILGYQPDDQKIVDHWSQLVCPEDMPATEAALKGYLEGKIPMFIIEQRLKTSNGDFKWILARGKVVSYDKNGKALRIVGTHTDISEQKRAALELRESNERLRIILEKSKEAEEALQFRNVILAAQQEASVEGMLVVGEDSKIISYNHRFIEMWNIPQAVINKGADMPVLECVTNEVLNSGEFLLKVQYLYDHRNEIGRDEIVLKNGLIFDRYSAPMIGPEDRYYGRIWSFHDISRHKQAEVELITAKEKAEESDRLKSAFLANMSHEIRTPMNGILGFAGLLKEPKLSGEEQLEYIGIIEKSGARMLNIINDIMCISKVESGQMEVAIRETNINDQIEYIHTFFKPEAEQKGLKLHLKKPLFGKEAMINTDKEKVYAILTNLVKNAIKFTHTGSIEFGYHLKSVKAGDDYSKPKTAKGAANESAVPAELEFYVKDTGSGICQEMQKFIFERFRQGSESLTRNYEGAGLGLAISRAYVHMLGGKIWVDSHEGKGSVFYFTLPYNGNREEKSTLKNSVSAEPTVSLDQCEGLGLKILIAEDDEGSAMFIQKVVSKLSREILKVKTGTEAIEACRSNPDIDLVLMDIKMPVMDGYEATMQIRRFNADVVIIAQTAFALLGDCEKTLKAGCNDYVSKPIDKNQLISILNKHFEKKGKESIILG